MDFTFRRNVPFNHSGCLFRMFTGMLWMELIIAWWWAGSSRVTCDQVIGLSFSLQVKWRRFARSSGSSNPRFVWLMPVIMSHPGKAAPQVGSRLQADVLWLGRSPLKLGQTCLLKLGNTEIPARIESILRSLDPATLETSEGGTAVERHQVAKCVIRLRRPIAFDVYDVVPETGRFVLVDNYVIAGGGIIRAILPEAVLSDTWQSHLTL